MELKYTILSLIAAVLLTGSCSIRDDRSDCTCDIILDFLYTGDGVDDIFADKIDKVNMYIYAADNSIAGEYVFDKEALTAEQGTHLHLSPGEYRIVCWGNVFENTTVDKEGSDARVAEPAHFSGDEDGFSGTDALYWSSLEITVPETLQDVTGTCVFECSHIDMQVRLVGFKDAMTIEGGKASINVSHTNCPEFTDFAHSPSKDERCDIVPQLLDDPDDESSWILSYNTLRFTEDEQTSIVISDAESGNVWHTISVKDFIDRYGVTVDGQQEACVSMQIILRGTEVTIIQWNVEEVFPVFD